MRTLKLVFNLNNKKTTTCSLADPKDGLTRAEVEAVTKDIVDQNILLAGDATPESVKDMYIQESKRIELITA